MICPNCTYRMYCHNTKPGSTRNTIRRSYNCPDCQYRVTTFEEIVQEGFTLTVGRGATIETRDAAYKRGLDDGVQALVKMAAGHVAAQTTLLPIMEQLGCDLADGITRSVQREQAKVIRDAVQKVKEQL